MGPVNVLQLLAPYKDMLFVHDKHSMFCLIQGSQAVGKMWFVQLFQLLLQPRSWAAAFQALLSEVNRVQYVLESWTSFSNGCFHCVPLMPVTCQADSDHAEDESCVVRVVLKCL